MTSDDQTEPILAALTAAAEATRAANRAACHAPATPESLCARTRILVELLAGVRQIAFTLGDHVDRAASDALANGLILDADEGVPVAEYIYKARGLLAAAAAKIEDVARLADQACSELSHLKLGAP